MRIMTVAAHGYRCEAGIPCAPCDPHPHVCIRQRLPGGMRLVGVFAPRLRACPRCPGTLTLDDKDLLAEQAGDGSIEGKHSRLPHAATEP